MSLLNELDSDTSRKFEEVRDLLEDASADLEEEQSRDEAAGALVDWAAYDEAVLTEPAVKQGLALTTAPRDRNEMLAALRAIAALDEWHRPLMPFLAEPTDVRSIFHEAADDRLVEKGRYNQDGTLGALVPARSSYMPMPIEQEVRDKLLELHHEATPLNVGHGKALLLTGLLDYTAYLPPLIVGDHPDDVGGPPRPMRVCYRRAPALPMPGRSAGAPFRVAVAPILQDAADAELTIGPVGNRYAVHPSRKPDRIADVLRLAREKRAELLFIPEMAVAADDFENLKKAIIDSGRTHFARTGVVSSLRYVLVGIATSAAGSACHRNHLTVLDGAGLEVASQDKLFRWNLSDIMQARLNVPPPAGGYAAMCYEDIEPGDEVWVLDLDGVGRIVTLICADVNADRPGDWLFTNAGLDWFNAPIMDQSTRWGVNGSKALDQWIAGRAHRAACATGARVVVTNSMLLSYRVNDANAALGSVSFPPFASVQVSLMVDGSAGDPTFLAIDVPLAPPGSVVEARDWGDGFERFPV